MLWLTTRNKYEELQVVKNQKKVTLSLTNIKQSEVCNLCSQSKHNLGITTIYYTYIPANF